MATATLVKDEPVTKSKTEEKHPASAYTRDERVNRLLSPSRVAKLRANLNLEGIGAVVVSKRANGDMILLDGQHRITALLEEGYDNFSVLTIVYHDLTEAQEAELFLVLNDRLLVDILERFRLQVSAEDPESTIIDREIRKAGFSPTSNSRNRLTCIKAIQTIYRGGSPSGHETHLKALRDTLHIIAEAWGTEGTALRQVVDGVGMFLINHGDEVDQSHLVKALAVLPGGANSIAVRTHYHTHEGGKKAKQAAELAVAEAYNEKMKASQRIKVQA